MSTSLSIRFEDDVLLRLRRRAQSMPGATASGVAHRLVDEGLRMAEYPGVVFKDGPSGRRAALAIGPDIWEVIKVLREIDERGEAAVTAAAEALVLPPAKVQLALTYYSGFPDEVDDEIAQAETASVAAEAAWESQRRLLA